MTATRAQVMTAVMNAISGMTFGSPINGVSAWRTGPQDPVTGEPAKLRLWSNVPPDQQPAVFLVTHREMDDYRGLGLLRRRLELGAWCYSRSDSAPGAPDLDVMMQAFEAAFNVPDNSSSGQFTLGGLVYWCRIEGRVFKDPGDLDSQAMLVVPIVVEMP